MMNALSNISVAIFLMGGTIYPYTSHAQSTSQKSPYVIFTGEVKGGQFGKDSIRVEYQPDIMYNTYPGLITESSIQYIKADKEGKFKLQLPSPSGIGEIRFDLYGYQHNLKKQSPNAYNGLLKNMFTSFFVEPEDSIHFSITNNGDTNGPFSVISGNGSEKYNAMKDISMTRFNPMIESSLDINDYLVSFKEAQDIELTAQNTLLNRYKSKISKSVFNLMKAEIQGNADLYLIKILFNLNNPKYQHRITSLFESHAPKIDSNASPLSTRNLQAIILNKILAIKLKQKDPMEKHKMKEIYFALKNSFSGLLKDKLISNYLLFEGWRTMEILNKSQNEYDECLQDCYETLQDSLLKSVLANKLKKIKRGVPAYNFDLPDAKGSRVKLEDFKGKVVLLDIYTTICTSCRIFAKTLKEEVFPVFKDNPNVVFMAISIEPDRKKWLKDIDVGKNTDKLHEIILHTEGLSLNHPMMKYYNTNSMPLLLLIDKDGNIANSSFDQLIAKSTGAKIIHLINNAINEKKNF